MRTFLVLICSLALACVATGVQKEGKENKTAPKKKQAQSAQHAAAPGGGPQKAKGSQKVTTAGGRPAASEFHKTQQYSAQVGSTARGGPQKAAGAGAQKTKEKTKRSQQIAAQGGRSHIGRSDGYMQQVDLASSAGAGAQKTKKLKGSATNAAAVPAVQLHKFSNTTFKTQHFNLASKSKPATSVAPAVKFQPGRHIEGSQHWQGQQYAVFRNYKSEWHEQNWWHSHYNNITWVFGAPYYWNSGYWFPAWGYASNAYYAWDGPIYGYNHLPPDQVIANVQAALQQQGYYQGEVDGLLGPLTRMAIADYQRANGLAETAAIDEPTLQSLGMT